MIVTSANRVPLQYHCGLSIERKDLASAHEEAGVINSMQVSAVISEGKKNIAIYSEDTDVFVLISYTYLAKFLEKQFFYKRALQSLRSDVNTQY